MVNVARVCAWMVWVCMQQVDRCVCARAGCGGGYGARQRYEVACLGTANGASWCVAQQESLLSCHIFAGLQCGWACRAVWLVVAAAASTLQQQLMFCECKTNMHYCVTVY